MTNVCQLSRDEQSSLDIFAGSATEGSCFSQGCTRTPEDQKTRTPVPLAVMGLRPDPLLAIEVVNLGDDAFVRLCVGNKKFYNYVILTK